jgi:hypothetical protein
MPSKCVMIFRIKTVRNWSVQSLALLVVIMYIERRNLTWSTPWSKALFEKLIVCQWVKKFVTFNENRRFIVVFTRTRHFFLFWARRLQPKPYHNLSMCSILIYFPFLEAFQSKYSSRSPHAHLSHRHWPDRRVGAWRWAQIVHSSRHSPLTYTLLTYKYIAQLHIL